MRRIERRREVRGAMVRRGIGQLIAWTGIWLGSRKCSITRLLRQIVALIDRVLRVRIRLDGAKRVGVVT